MNYKNLKNSIKLQKAAKCLIGFCVLSLALASLFYSPQTFSTTITTSCESYSGADFKPGENCLYNNRPLCSTIPSAPYTIPSSSIVSGTAIPRVNCYNLSDITLCNQLQSAQSQVPSKTCAKNCNDASFNPGEATDIRGFDYAVHNRDCVRFCDEVAAENTAFGSSISVNTNTCVARKCHQVTGINAVPNTNCNSLSCNLLSVNELVAAGTKTRDYYDYYKSAANTSKTQIEKDEATLLVGKNLFCNGSTTYNDKVLKCYHFSEQQLPYALRDVMCKTHNCTPTCTNYIATTDVNGDGVVANGSVADSDLDSNDVLNISTKGSTYTLAYNQNINGQQDLTSTSLCTPIQCKPIINRQYRCTTNGTNISGKSTDDIVRNNFCDTSPKPGSTCVSNYCYKVIDCNLLANVNEPECAVGDDGAVGSTEDTMDSWFYRPAPLSKATNGAGAIRTLGRSGKNELCYTESQLKDGTDGSEDGHWGLDVEFTIPMPAPIPDIRIDLGWFHSSLLPDRTRSPGICSVDNVGFRGTGYIYLCYGDTHPGGQLFAKVADYTAYHKGYVKTTFTEGNALHEVTVCLRFRNALRPDDGSSETCGARECAISCMGFMGGCSQQNCGYDVCRTLKVEDINPHECVMSDNLFDGEVGRNISDKKCMSVIDNYLRLRIQKYGDKICSFLDSKGQVAYEIDWFANGREKIGSRCLDGTTKANCSAFDTNKEPGSAEKWRTVSLSSEVHIPYIKNNKTSEPYGYNDKNGQLFLEQNCIKAPLRLPTEKLYNLANSSNSPKLFTPSVYVNSAMTKRGSNTISVPLTTFDAFGVTDFNYPEIEVRFGTTRELLSLGMNYTGYEAEGSRDPLGDKTITTTINSINYSAEIFVRKEFNITTLQPQFCLYRKVKDINGTYLLPAQLQCIDRKTPDIVSSSSQLMIYPDPANTYNSSKIVLRFARFGANGVFNNCSGDDECSTELKIENTNSSIPTCSSAVEKYQVCAQRDECSKLNNECMQNEIDMQTAKINHQPYDSYLTVRSICNESLLPLCNQKKGITSAGGNIINQTPSGASVDSKAYGWFNEICFKPGENTISFDGKLKKVVAYDPSTITGNVKGKCIVSTTLSPYLTDSDPNTNCDSGGKAPNCICIDAIDDATLDPGTVIRTQTQREAGLCVDMPLAQTCPTLTYNAVPNSNDPVNDPDYTTASLNILEAAGYGTTAGKVHTSHRARTLDIAGGHADFPLSIVGMNNVEGSCKGYWRSPISGSGISAYPTRSCLLSGGVGTWDVSVSNACIPYTCSAISTSGLEASGSYQGNYGIGKTGENIGDVEGFATWPNYTKTKDFAEPVNAVACIPGFKQSGATAVMSGTTITGYNGGTIPQRTCNQIGQWGTVTSGTQCVRISCDAPVLNHTASTMTVAQWAEWSKTGGADFTSILASRNKDSAAVATQYGICNNSLGFYKLGGSNPSRTCDYLGNWGTVQNPCTTRCKFVDTEIDAKNSNNGYAYWPQTDIPIGTSASVNAVHPTNSSLKCVAGYVPYPYPPYRNVNGDLFTLTSGTADYATTIPLTYKNDAGTVLDSRAADNPPKRLCKSVTQDGTTSNFYYAASSQCIAQCPGGNLSHLNSSRTGTSASYNPNAQEGSVTDSRIGIGITKHNVSTIVDPSGVLYLAWAPTDLGHWAFISNAGYQVDTPNLNGQAANLYSDINRTNGFYIVARYCGSDGKWQDPKPQCASHGVIDDSHATYASNSSEHTTSKTLNINEVASSSACTGSPYFPTNAAGDAPTTASDIISFTCKYSDSTTKKIDQTFYEYKAGYNCAAFCSANSSTNFGSEQYSTDVTTIYKQNGASLSLKCNSGYGKFVGGSGGDNNCGRTASDRSSTSPSVTCNNGTWGTVSNKCTACRSCPGNSISTASDNIDLNIGGGNCGSKSADLPLSTYMGKCSSSLFNNKAHNTCQRLSYVESQYWTCERRCNDGVSMCDRHSDLNFSITVKCVDKLWIYQSCSDDSYSSCSTNGF